MTKREKLCLQMRNKRGTEETYCMHYLKSKGVYLRALFLGLSPVAMFILCAISVAVIFTQDFDDNSVFLKYLPHLFAAVTGFFYLGIIFKGLWYWKYTRHVFVTNEGIWVMCCSALWWKAAPDFIGKRRLLAPSWSLYSWDELKSVTDKNPIDNSRLGKTIAFFENYNDFICKSSKHTTIYLKRWDGVERVDFLKNEYAQEILAYSKTHKRAARKSKKTNEDEPVTDENE